ncbi:MAG: hypothetical protein ACREMO_02675, partial [Gemmatimonadales bacterium]
MTAALPLALNLETGPASRRAGDLLAEARAHERAGALSEAVGCYQAAVDEAARTLDRRVEAEALRRLGVVRHHQNDRALAVELCRRSHQVAGEVDDPILAGEALNALAGFEFEEGAIESARIMFHRALELGGRHPALRGRIEQNLGILANIQGDHSAALDHYHRSLEACRSSGDQKGCAIAYHN